MILRSLLAVLLAAMSSVSFSQLSDCEPIFSTAVLEVNKIRARVGTPNVFFRNSGDAGFAVPAEDSVHSIYAHNDWIGGLTADGSLHLAAGTYNSGGGSDFFTGPLSNDGAAMTEEELCESYSGLYHAKRIDALVHQEYYDRSDLVALGSDLSILLQPPFESGYEPPEYFYSWPAHNDDPSFDYFLAPFFDRDNDGQYEPDEGDYPGFDITGTCSCTDPDFNSPAYLQGHEAIWQVYNDSGLHTETGGTPMGIEVQCTTFGFDHCGTLDETLFQRKRIINRSSNTYLDTYIGQWVDTDLGCPTDDYVGCDVSRGFAYTYNGDNNDADCDGVKGYGQNLPILSFQYLAGPYQDTDGMDNPQIYSLQDAIDSTGITYSGLGIGYGDGVVDNERMKMRRFTYYQSYDILPTYPNSEPDEAIEFFQYLSGKWLDDGPVTYGGNGVTGTIPVQFMFPGGSDPLGYSTQGEIVNGNWSEVSAGNVPGDRRFVATTGPFTFEPGEVEEIVTAFNWTQGLGDPIITQNSMKIESDYIQTQFEYCFQLIDELTPVQEFTYTQNGNDLTFSLPYYYQYDADWTFGDGDYGQGLSVEHPYSEIGNYDVCVTVYSCSGPEELCESITISSLDLQEFESEELILIYPNPAEDELYILSSRLGTDIGSVDIYDVEGRLMQSAVWSENQEFLLLDEKIGQGFYTAAITYKDGLRKSKSFLKN